MKFGVDLPTPPTPEALPGGAGQPDQPLRGPSVVPKSECHRARTSCLVVNSDDLSSRATRFRAVVGIVRTCATQGGPTPLTFTGPWTLRFGAAHSGSGQGFPRCTGLLPRRTLEVPGRRPRHRPEGSAPTMDDIHQSFARQGLVRPWEGRVLGGVCAGLGRRFGIVPWHARIIFVLLLMVIPGSQI